MNLVILSIVLIMSLVLGMGVSNPIVLVLLMEVMLFTFLFMVYEYKMLNYSAACIKYFMSQSMAGLMLLVASFYFMGLDTGMPLWYIFMTYMGLLIKLGGFPMHFWVVSVFSELPIFMLGVLGMPMKVLPLSFMFRVLLFRFTPLYALEILMFLGVVSMMMGMILGLTATQLRGVLGASSITHTGWFFFAMYSKVIVEYFLLYSISLILVLWAIKILSPLVMSLSLFGLAGLPPFSVFFAKVLVLSGLISFKVMLVFMVLALFTSVFSLFYYLKYSFYFFLQQHVLSGFGWPLVLFLTVNMSSVFMVLLLFFYGRVWL